MNRQDAKRISEIITIEDYKQMFLNAQNSIKDWEERAIVNKGMTKGAAFNILTLRGKVMTYDEISDVHPLGRVNSIREFGKYLPPSYQKEKQDKSKLPPNVHHEPPDFLIDF